MVLRARAALMNNKGPGGGDPCVPEILKEIPAIVVELVEQVRGLFCLRLAGRFVEELDTWRKLVLVFIGKDAKPEDFNGFRGITMISCFSKWYMGSLMLLYEEKTIRPEHWENVVFLGFSPGQHCGTITSGILMAFRAAWEWRTTCPLFMLAGDVLQAFDHVTPLAMAWAMEQANANDNLIAAVLEESIDLSATVLKIWKWNVLTLVFGRALKRLPRLSGTSSRHCLLFSC